MRDSIRHRLARLAEQQHAVVARAQLHGLGFTPQQVRDLRESGRLVAVHVGVYRVGGAPPTWRGAVLAACFAGGRRAVASHRSAAALWGLAGGRRDLVEITCPRWRRSRQPGLVVHETSRLDAPLAATVGPIPTACPELTLLQLGAVCGPRTVEMAYERARHEGLVTWESCDALLARLARSGRNGVAVLRRVLELRGPGSRPTESEMETLLLQALRSAGYAAPVAQHEVRDPAGRFVARVDVAYPADRVAIEYDSVRYHSTELERARDDERRNRITGAGWWLLVARRDDLRAGAPRLLAQLRACLHAA